MRLRDARQAELYRHSLFDWINSDSISPHERLTILPILANFSMGFRDINKWVLRYPAAKDDRERAINTHTFEDETHSRLYLEDWRRLGLDDRYSWRAGDVLWWTFLADATEPLRRHGAYFLRLDSEDGGDPALRFAHSEVIEACGKVFFDNIEKVATAASGATGVEYRYLGAYHLERESGHVDTEGAFEGLELDEPRYEAARLLVETMFAAFDELFTCFLEFARHHVTTATPPKAVIEIVEPASDGHPATSIDCGHTDADAVLGLRMVRTARHPFYAWLRDEEELSAKQKLQRFVPLWAYDILGYADLNRYSLSFPDPATPVERTVNALTRDLQTHNVLYLNDWQALGLDEVLGWSAGDALEFFYLDPRMDVHRRNIVKFTRLAARHGAPELRLWLVKTLESSGDAFFANTRALALEAERAGGIRLDYLAGRHDGAHAPTTELASGVVLGERQVRAAIEIVDTVFDALDEQLDISLDTALSNLFRVP